MVQVLPFLRLKSLRSVATMKAHTLNDSDLTPPTAFVPFLQTSNATSLTLDETDIVPNDAIKTLRVFKALENLRWSQDITCYSIGTCYAPFFSSIGDALTIHKSTLKVLDLDIKHRHCNKSGHAANPNADANYHLPEYKYIWDAEAEGSIRPPRNAILIGPLNDFTSLNTLSIDVTALCGHQHWVLAPTQMVDSLPKGLKTLRLRVTLDPHPEL